MIWLKGTKEPYRMFTSRSEYRFCLGLISRQRLTPIGIDVGCVEKIEKNFKKKIANIKRVSKSPKA